MEIGILTVGDEVLAGDTENTNATWLARQVNEAGSKVVRIMVLPDDRQLIADTVREWSESFDAVIVTGGLGGTHDDVTIDAIADVFDRDLMVDEQVRENAIQTVQTYRDTHPEIVDDHDPDVDIDAWASVPEGSRALVNPVGLSPGCVIENVYVFPGVPAEARALFEQVSEEFNGNAVSSTVYTRQPESSMIRAIEGVRDRFDATIGSYSDPEGLNRLKVTTTDPEELDRAIEWLCNQINCE